MKHFLLFFIAALISFAAYADPFERDSVIQAQALSKSQIYDALKRSFVTNFKDSRDVLEVDDRQNGHIMAKVHFTFNVNNMTWHAMSGYISCVVEINIKDGRYKVRLTDFHHEAMENPHGEKARRKWSEGIIMNKLPAEYEKGALNKQHREAYKRILPAINGWCDDWFFFLGNATSNFKPVDEEDW